MSTRLDNEFTVPVPVERAWTVLLDVERIAPCMPGATLESVEGDTVTGRVKVKVGPVTVTYQGEARFAEKDAERRVVTIDADGKEARGAGTASARVQASLHDEDGTTRVRVGTDLNVTGRIAQLGRGMIADVSGKLVDRFASNLAAELERESEPDESGGGSTPTSVPEETTAVTTATAESAAPGVPSAGPDTSPARASGRMAVDTGEESLNLMDIAGGPLVKRALPVLVAAIMGLVVLRKLRKWRGGG